MIKGTEADKKAPVFTDLSVTLDRIAGWIRGLKLEGYLNFSQPAFQAAEDFFQSQRYFIIMGNTESFSHAKEVYGNISQENAFLFYWSRIRLFQLKLLTNDQSLIHPENIRRLKGKLIAEIVKKTQDANLLLSLTEFDLSRETTNLIMQALWDNIGSYEDAVKVRVLRLLTNCHFIGQDGVENFIKNCRTVLQTINGLNTESIQTRLAYYEQSQLHIAKAHYQRQDYSESFRWIEYVLQNLVDVTSEQLELLEEMALSDKVFTTECLSTHNNLRLFLFEHYLDKDIDKAKKYFVLINRGTLNNTQNFHLDNLKNTLIERDYANLHKYVRAASDRLGELWITLNDAEAAYDALFLKINLEAMLTSVEGIGAVDKRLSHLQFSLTQTLAKRWSYIQDSRLSYIFNNSETNRICTDLAEKIDPQHKYKILMPTLVRETDGYGNSINELKLGQFILTENKQDFIALKPLFENAISRVKRCINDELYSYPNPHLETPGADADLIAVRKVATKKLTEKEKEHISLILSKGKRFFELAQKGIVAAEFTALAAFEQLRKGLQAEHETKTERNAGTPALNATRNFVNWFKGLSSENQKRIQSMHCETKSCGFEYLWKRIYKSEEDIIWCGLFLMSTPASAEGYQRSDKRHLYLYKDNDLFFYFACDGTKYFLDDNVKDYLRIAKFNQPSNNPAKCEVKEICDLVLKITSERDHTYFPNPQNLEEIEKRDESNFYCTYEVGYIVEAFKDDNNQALLDIKEGLGIFEEEAEWATVQEENLKAIEKGLPEDKVSELKTPTQYPSDPDLQTLIAMGLFLQKEIDKLVNPKFKSIQQFYKTQLIAINHVIENAHVTDKIILHKMIMRIKTILIAHLLLDRNAKSSTRIPIPESFVSKDDLNIFRSYYRRGTKEQAYKKLNDLGDWAYTSELEKIILYLNVRSILPLGSGFDKKKSIIYVDYNKPKTPFYLAIDGKDLYFRSIEDAATELKLRKILPPKVAEQIRQLDDRINHPKNSDEIKSNLLNLRTVLTNEAVKRVANNETQDEILENTSITTIVNAVGTMISDIHKSDDPQSRRYVINNCRETLDNETICHTVGKVLLALFAAVLLTCVLSSAVGVGAVAVVGTKAAFAAGFGSSTAFSIKGACLAGVCLWESFRPNAVEKSIDNTLNSAARLGRQR